MQAPRFAPQATGTKTTIPGTIVEVITHPASAGFSIFGFEIFAPIPERYTIVVELELKTVQRIFRERYPPPESLAARANWRDPTPYRAPRIKQHLSDDPSPDMLKKGTSVNVVCQASSAAEQQYTGSAPFMVRSVELAD